jgi:hypothetical protein
MPITHAKTCAKPDGPDSSQILSSDWNADHVGDVYQVATVTLQAADILTIDDTPVEIIPAPGANKLILPLAAAYAYNFGTTPYTLPGPVDTLTLDYVNRLPTTADWWTGLATIGVLDQSSDVRGPLLEGNNSYSGRFGGIYDAVDQPFSCQSESGDGAPTGGDGTLTLVVCYVVVDLT